MKAYIQSLLNQLSLLDTDDSIHLVDEFFVINTNQHHFWIDEAIELIGLA